MDEPFSGRVANAREYGMDEPCVFGQGVSQNKAHQAVMLTVLKLLIEHGVELRHEIALDQYFKTINIEGETTAYIAQTMILPAALKTLAPLPRAGSGGAAEYLPADVLAAGSVATREPLQLFEELTAQITRSPPDFERGLATTDEKLGAGFIEGLTAALGTEAALALTGAATVYPAARAARVEPAEALRYE